MRFEVHVKADDLKAEAARRIEARYPLWKQVNIISEGGAAHAEMRTFIDGVRSASDRIEARGTIRADFRDDTHWPEAAAPSKR
jgi:hypothetical protein